MKRTCLFAIGLFLLVFLALPAGAGAADAVHSGTFGADGTELTWVLDSEGTLTIRGSGAMDRETWDEEGYRLEEAPFIWPWDVYRDQIETVVLEEGVTRIGPYAFSSYPVLTSVSLPLSLSEEDPYLSGGSGGVGFLYRCPRLERIEMPVGHKTLFTQDGLLYRKDDDGGITLLLCPDGRAEAEIADTTAMLWPRAFADCGRLTEIVIPEGVGYLMPGTFENCAALRSVTFPGESCYLDTDSMMFAFLGCTGLTSVTVPDTDPDHSTLEGVLYNKARTELIFCPGGKTSLTIPASVTAVDDLRGAVSLTGLAVDPDNRTFSARNDLLCSRDGTRVVRCPGGLTGAVIPEGVTEIGETAFLGCTGLTSVTIPDSVTGIGLSAFSSCTGLTDVFYKGTPQEWSALTEQAGWSNDTLLDARVWYVGGGSGIPGAALAPDGTLTAQVWPAEADLTVRAAFYDADGRMLGTESRTLPAGGGVSLRLSGPEGTDSAGVFLLDGDQAPVCPAVTASPTA